MSSLNQSGWKPEMGSRYESAPATYTGNKALMLEEPLIFEIGTAEITGVDGVYSRTIIAADTAEVHPFEIVWTE